MLNYTQDGCLVQNYSELVLTSADTSAHQMVSTAYQLTGGTLTNIGVVATFAYTGPLPSWVLNGMVVAITGMTDANFNGYFPISIPVKTQVAATFPAASTSFSYQMPAVPASGSGTPVVSTLKVRTALVRAPSTNVGTVTFGPNANGTARPLIAGQEYVIPQLIDNQGNPTRFDLALWYWVTANSGDKVSILWLSIAFMLFFLTGANAQPAGGGYSPYPASAFSQGLLTNSTQGGWQTALGVSATNSGAANTFNATFVSPYGSDSTGKTNDVFHPFLTLNAANTASTKGETVHVNPGLYNEIILLKDGVNWYFEPGATNLYTGLDSSPMWRDYPTPGTPATGAGVNVSITGYGTFIWNSSDTTYAFESPGSGLPAAGNTIGLPSAGSFGTGVMCIQNSNSVINFEGYCYMGGADTVANAGIVSALWVYNCKKVTFRCRGGGNYIFGADNEVSMGYWLHGEVYERFDQGVELDEGPAFAAGDDSLNDQGLPYVETSWYIDSPEVICTNASGQNATFSFYMYTQNPRVWVTCPVIANMGPNNGNGSAINILSCGNFYFPNIQRIQTTGANCPVVNLAGFTQIVTNRPSLLWMNGLSIKSKTEWINHSGGTLYADFLNGVDLGGMTNGITISTDNLGNDTGTDSYIAIHHGLITNGPGIFYKAGKLHLTDSIIDTSTTATALSYGANILANNASFQNCTFLVPANSVCFNGGSFNVQTLGVYANQTNATALTLTPDGGFYYNPSTK